LQGLSLGGEMPAAITFVAEHANPERRAFSLATLFFGVNFGLMLGSLMTSLVSSYLTDAQMMAYGWRIPFLLGGVFGIIAVYLRRYLKETNAFMAIEKNDIQKIPMMTVLRGHSKEVLLGLCLIAIGSVTVFLYLYWPQYLHQYLHYDFTKLMRINTLGTLVLSVTILLGGLMADRIGYKKAFFVSIMLLLLLTYPLFHLFHLNDISWVMCSYLIFSIFFGLIPSAYSAIVSTLFPTNIRYSGIALSYNGAYAIFGGLSPLVCTIAINQFNSLYAPAFYVMAVACISGLACYTLRSIPVLQQ
jgi:MHS family proline/betaine transporter-like MFS transporter